MGRLSQPFYLTVIYDIQPACLRVLKCYSAVDRGSPTSTQPRLPSEIRKQEKVIKNPSGDWWVVLWCGSYERTWQGNDLKICDAFPVFFNDKSSTNNNKTGRANRETFQLSGFRKTEFSQRLSDQILANFKQLPDGQTLRIYHRRFAQGSLS